MSGLTEAELIAAFKKAVARPEYGPDRVNITLPVAQVRRLLDIVDRYTHTEEAT